MLADRYAFPQSDKQLPESLKKEVEDNLQQAVAFETAGDYNQAAYFYTKAATTYWVNGVSTNAINTFLKAAAMNERIDNQNALKIIYTNIGMVYADREEYANALTYFEKSLSISRKMKRKQDIASSLINIANTYSETNIFDKAAKVLEEANTIARELNDAKLLRNTYSLLAEVYDKLGNSEKSAEYFSLYTAFTRKIQKEELQRKEAEARQIVDDAQSKVREAEIQKQLTQKELEAKKSELETTEENLERVAQLSREQQMQIDLLSKEKELKDAIINNQRLVRNIFIVIVLATAAFSGLVLYSLMAKKKANEQLARQNREIAQQRDLIEEKSFELIKAMGQIEKQNKNITSSINYAQRIQQALLPTYDYLVNVIPDSFIMLQPRDIVSGDFYWFTGYTARHGSQTKGNRNFIRIPNLDQDDSGFIITAADCTGHGVPGAFMSMIGFNLLETITRSGTVRPHEMLNELHRSIRYLLKQYNSDSRDGMDMALCVIKDKGRKVEFAGAKNPLYYITNGELFHVKGDPVPVGGIQKETRREFTLNTIEVTAPTCFYIFSDGYIDQFGGDEGQKFSSKRFKELLLEIHHLPMIQQQEILETKLDEWRGTNYKPVDDVLVMGFRLGDKPIDI